MYGNFAGGHKVTVTFVYNTTPRQQAPEIQNLHLPLYMIHKCICNWITYGGFKYLLCFLFCIYHVIDITVRALQFGKVKKQRLWNGKCIPTSYLMYRRSKLPKVSGGKGFCWSRNCIFSKPCVGELSMFINAWLCKVTASSSSSARGGMSVNASHAASSNRKISDHQHLGKQSSQNLLTSIW